MPDDDQPSQKPPNHVRLGANQPLTIAPGHVVIVRYGTFDSYVAVIATIDGPDAELTWTPKGKPRSVPLGMILCSVGQGSATLDPSSIPEYQSEPTEQPRRRRATV